MGCVVEMEELNAQPAKELVVSLVLLFGWIVLVRARILTVLSVVVTAVTGTINWNPARFVMARVEKPAPAVMAREG